MLWPDEVRTFFANGGAPNFHVAAIIKPIDLSTDGQITVGYWSGHEDIPLTLDGTLYTLLGTRGALQITNPTYAAGTEIRNYSARMFGLSEQAVDLLRAYDVEQAPAELWQLCFNQGAAFIGARRLAKGEVDGAPQTIGAKGQGATLELTIASALRAGTRTTASKKSHASYLLRDGDTSMEYASLKDVDSDTWGPRA